LSGLNNYPNPQDQDWGIEFVPTTDLMLTTLLIWDSGGNDFSTFDGDVAIWDVSNPSTPVVAGAITAPGAPTLPSASLHLGVWRVADVPDTLLMSGQTYRLAADGFRDGDVGRLIGVTPVLNGITLTANPGVETVSGSPYLLGPEYPNAAGANQIYVTSSFTYTAVPEPGSVWLVGLFTVPTCCGPDAK
jgi:hypothetical protein